MKKNVKGSIGWHFPPTNGGQGDGFNDSGIAHFDGAPLASLARETIQNSLDAASAPDVPVHMDFELIDLSQEDIGHDELATAVDACLQIAAGDIVVTKRLEEARDSLDQGDIPCLRISDRNTTGLRDEQWRTLVKMRGKSYKPGVEGAGGSFGIGKFAPYSVSSIRTVFYWTSYRDEDEILVERCQGKCILMSHEGPDGETQGTGFYGQKEECSHLDGLAVPRAFRVLASSETPVEGTSIAVAGFREVAGWRERIASSVIGNFFFALSEGKLTVNVEPDDSGLYEIDAGSLPIWFDRLSETVSSIDGFPEETLERLRDAQVFWAISSGKDPVAEKQDSDLGHCRLWIRVGDGLPSNVAFVRRTGMLITSQQRHLVRFPAYRDFAALCVFEDPAGNEFLRQMENPAHDQFEPERLGEDRDRGRRALKRITDWIRAEVRKRAGPPEGGQTAMLSELAAYLPDYDPNEPLDDYDGEAVRKDGEPGFGKQITLTLRPVRRSVSPRLPANEEEGTDGDGDDEGGHGGSGEGVGGEGGGDGGGGYGEGEGGTGPKGGGRGAIAIPVRDVRLTPIDADNNRYRLSFRAELDGIARLTLDEAGDSSVVRRDDVRSAIEGTCLDQMPVRSRGPNTIEITADAPIGDRAWRLSVSQSKEDDSEV